MDIGWFRDLVICISGLVATAVVIFIAILAYLIYKRTKPILDSMQSASATIQEITSSVKEEIMKPIVNFAALIRGIAQGIELATKIFKREEKEEQEGGRNGG
jgi:uncharacterized membrane protein